ncbi:MAG TPA: hypothetical protein VM012_00555 [Flavitalea sp.]|nr:hypothetical protein [Flavitalea sp.]
MKKATLFLLPVLLCLITEAQQANYYHFTEEFYFVKEVPAVNYRGKNFRYEIAVKSNPADTISKVRIHGIGVGKNNDDYLNSDFRIENRQEQDWTVYTIVGTVDPLAWKLWFYAAVNGNGHFFFDDVNCYIEESPGKWKQLHLYNSSFEEKSSDIFKGYYVSRKRSDKIRTTLSSEVYKTGRRSLHVQTRSQKPVIETDNAKN